MDRRIIRILSGDSMSNFIKLNSSLFDRPRFSTWSQNSKRKGKLLNMIWKIENVTILKERDGDILGDGKFSGIQIFRIWDFEILGILKERDGDILGDGKFSGFPKHDAGNLKRSNESGRRKTRNTKI